MTVDDASRKRRPYASRMPLEQRRTELMDAAMRVQARDGFGALTVDAITREAGVTKPVLYGAFPTLRALLEALLEREEATALGQLTAALPLAIFGDPARLAERVTRAWIRVVQRNPEPWRVILASGAGTPAVIEEHVENGRKLIREQLTRLIASQLPPDVSADPAILARALVATAEHFGRLLVTDPDSVDVDALASTVQAMVTGVLRQRG